MSTSKDLRAAVRWLLGVPLFVCGVASVAGEESFPDVIATVRVSATAVNEDAQNVAASLSIVEGQELFQRTQPTLGDTLNGLPGVHADTFGAGASRPVIRGQSAPRVEVLSDSGALLDASDISPDHAVTAEPFLIERIEVLRGPATLLYGSGAIGGVVNIIDGKIPTQLPEDGFEGAVAARGVTASREKAAMLKATSQLTEHWVAHVEAVGRDAGDYRVADWHERRVAGSFSESLNGSVGLSWVGDRGYLGLAYTYRDDHYGVPGHSHEYASCHPHGSTLHCGGHDEDTGEEHDHDHDHAHEAVPEIELLSRRVDVRGEIRQPLAGVERIRLRASHTDYRHDELDEGLIATTFRKEGQQARIEVQHDEVFGWGGVFGLQYGRTKFTPRGSEAFLPSTDSESFGVFAVEHFELSPAWHVEAGARHEWQKHRPLDDPRQRPKYSDTATSMSAAAIWEFVPNYFMTFSVARSERVPHAQELYARGIHLATNTYECGLMPHPLTCGGVDNNKPLRMETSNNVEVLLRKLTGSLTFSVGAFLNRVDDYVHARTLDQFESFRLVKYTQQDAEFVGVEGEVTYRFNPLVSATVFGDYVQGQLRNAGGDLPRIPAARYGARVHTQARGYGAELEYYRVQRQNDIAAFETPTPSHNMVNLTLSYRSRSEGGYSVFLRASNLLDETVWNHASFLASSVPLPGRSVSVGAQWSF